MLLLLWCAIIREVREKKNEREADDDGSVSQGRERAKGSSDHFVTNHRAVFVEPNN
jgi:hypothetical protein